MKQSNQHSKRTASNRSGKRPERPAYRQIGQIGQQSTGQKKPYDQFTFCDQAAFRDVIRALDITNKTAERRLIAEWRANARVYADGRVRTFTTPNRTPPPLVMSVPPLSLLVHVVRVHLTSIEEGYSN